MKTINLKTIIALIMILLTIADFISAVILTLFNSPVALIFLMLFIPLFIGTFIFSVEISDPKHRSGAFYEE